MLETMVNVYPSKEVTVKLNISQEIHFPGGVIVNTNISSLVTGTMAFAGMRWKSAMLGIGHSLMVIPPIGNSSRFSSMWKQVTTMEFWSFIM